MDDPADTCWSWPHWKFGLRRDDLFTKLHDQYNTVQTPILDPEAFHHDVYEISSQANSADEFHTMLRARKQRRLRELDDSLKSAAFEIVANPNLVGTDQWQHAVQLFRTNSLDSLVRYFASYLPHDHPWYKKGSTCSSETGSSVDSFAPSHGSLFDDDDGPIMTDEPLDFPSTLEHHLPPSPRSMTMCSDSSVASPIDDAVHDYDLNTLTPARTLSYSESEPDCCELSEPHTHFNEEAELTSPDVESPAISITTTTDAAATGVEDEVAGTTISESGEDDATPLPLMTDGSDLPTPKPEGASFFDTAPRLPRRRHRSLSPSRPHPLSEHEVDDLLSTHRDPRSAVQCMQLSRRRREQSPMQRKRRGPGESLTRIQKPSPDTSRARPRARKGCDS
ncbi:hypothetical protein QBC35DRAFT_16838 [Podospora australis]|uniref:Uncharacterized protein n=1 Tax=Podospora australis TaxID=1536484 RepID=A0AAN6WNZ8_9PEZI|nr:hypothetical protein QBC35DRAFT_16838 [Podospora australis]